MTVEPKMLTDGQVTGLCRWIALGSNHMRETPWDNQVDLNFWRITFSGSPQTDAPLGADDLRDVKKLLMDMFNTYVPSLVAEVMEKRGLTSHWAPK